MGNLGSWPAKFWYLLGGGVLGSLLSCALIWTWFRLNPRGAAERIQKRFDRRATISTTLSALGGGAVFTSLLAALYQVANPGVPSEMKLNAAAFTLIAGILCAAIIVLIGRLVAKEPISIDSKWGSLGSARTGYDISQPVALLGVFVGCIMALLVLSYEGSNSRQRSEAERRTQGLKLTLDSTPTSDAATREDKQ